MIVDVRIVVFFTEFVFQSSDYADHVSVGAFDGEAAEVSCECEPVFEHPENFVDQGFLAICHIFPVFCFKVVAVILHEVDNALANFVIFSRDVCCPCDVSEFGLDCRYYGE